jgi:hypothetical protein
MTLIYQAEEWDFFAAFLNGHLTAGMEVASRRGIQRARNFSLQDDALPLLLNPRIRDRHS